MSGADPKADVLEMLRELGELTLLDEGDPQAFRVRAYESAAKGVEAHAGDLAKMSAKELQKIEGIGKSTAEKIRELVETGRVKKIDELRAKHPPGVVALLGVPGLGPKGIARVRAELGVASVEDLARAVTEQKLRGMKGFGEKAEAKIAASLARLAAQGAIGRTPVSVAMPVAERVRDLVASLPGVSHATICGSLRRFAETVGDVDVVVAAESAEPVMEAFVAMGVVDRVIARGATKTSVVTRRGLQIDLRVVPKESIGAALMYFTGSKGHNVKLRARALARGLTLNEYALTEVEGGRVVARETEEEVYAALGLPWIAPPLREDAGEIDLAERGALPEVLVPSDVLGDFHVHTTVSGDGRSSLEEVVRAARARGYKVLALTDHAEGTVAGATRDAFLEQRAKIRALQAAIGEREIRLLHGVELNIGKDGELDYDAEFRAGFDFCLASIHDHFDLDRAAQTRRVVAAMRDPCVKMIGHLSARMIGARPGVDLDIDAVFAAAEETGTALEVNGSLPRLDVSVDVLRRGRDRNVTFVLTSDAHHERELDRVRFACLNATKAWIPRSRIANTWPAERLAAWATGTD